MKRLNKKVVLRVEALESLQLLSTMPGVPTTGTNTGLGNVGSVSISDALDLQQDASDGILEQYISQIEVARGRQANIRAFASTIISDHQLSGFDLQNTAGSVGVTLPSGISTPTGIHFAEMVSSAARGKNLDQVYLKVIRQSHAQAAASDQQLISTTTNAAVKAYATEALAVDVNHLQGAKQLISQPKSTYQPTVPMPSLVPTPTPATPGTPASASDAQALTQNASGGYLELFISEMELLYGSRNDVQQFAQTVVGDHQVTNYGLITTALASGVGFAGGIQQPSDLSDFQQVLGAINNSNGNNSNSNSNRGNGNNSNNYGNSVDRAYLQVMQKINAQDVASGNQLISSTTNQGIKAFAAGNLMFDTAHLQAVQMLLSQQTNSYPPSGY